MRRIGELYEIERGIAAEPPDIRRNARKASRFKALEFFAWADDVLARASARSPLAETLRYAVKLNGVNPQDWLADVLDRIGEGYPINRIDDLISWNSSASQA
ncbi:IS66 C-terminal element [Sphingobium faniae]|nr:IS66 C-terminal element [Sphingobium faniae]